MCCQFGKDGRYCFMVCEAITGYTVAKIGTVAHTTVSRPGWILPEIDGTACPPRLHGGTTPAVARTTPAITRTTPVSIGPHQSWLRTTLAIAKTKPAITRTTPISLGPRHSWLRTALAITRTTTFIKTILLVWLAKEVNLQIKIMKLVKGDGRPDWHLLWWM